MGAKELDGKLYGHEQYVVVKTIACRISHPARMLVCYVQSWLGSFTSPSPVSPLHRPNDTIKRNAMLSYVWVRSSHQGASSLLCSTIYCLLTMELLKSYDLKSESSMRSNYLVLSD